MKNGPGPEADEWMFDGALYSSKGVNGRSHGGRIFTIIIFAAAIIMVYMTGDDLSAGTKTMMITVGAIILAAGIAVTAFLMISDPKTEKKVHFAVFKQHLLILPKSRSKGTEYVHIPFNEIIGYVFRQYDSRSSGDIGHHYQNYGELKIVTRNSEYETEIANISLARAWMHKSLSMEETTNGRWDTPRIEVSSGTLKNKGPKEYDHKMSENALYASGGVVKKVTLMLAGLFLTFAPIAVLMIVLVSMQDNVHDEMSAWVITCGITILTGIAVLAISALRYSHVAKRVHFAVFRDHLVILPTDGPSKHPEYIRIPYRDITDYKFERSIPYAPSYEGELIVTTKQSRYRTDIRDIELARDWMIKFAAVSEKTQ
ncbi:MAG: hypothetical protein FWG58_04790 [Methanomassiliicoccaceae archaeon]|nr:hypothetical protein [Methanomassiliicoccaceae archaeon]